MYRRLCFGGKAKGPGVDWKEAVSWFEFEVTAAVKFSHRSEIQRGGLVRSMKSTCRPRCLLHSLDGGAEGV
jgi:hypothetical protein